MNDSPGTLHVPGRAGVLDPTREALGELLLSSPIVGGPGDAENGEQLGTSLLQSLTSPVSLCFCRKLFPPTTSHILQLMHTYTSFSICMDNNTHKVHSKSGKSQMGVHEQIAASTKQFNKHKEVHYKNNTVCMCITIYSPQKFQQPRGLHEQCRLHIQYSQLTRNQSISHLE